MNRRQFLQSAGALPLLLWAPRALALSGRPRVLVLVELSGGNDGLSTVIPFADPAYGRLRPGLAVGRDRALALSGGLGLHPGLDPLMESWTAQEFAVVLGVGYENPNRSHFRSIEIWETASQADEYLTSGWLARVLPSLPGAGAATGAIVVGDRDEGPMAGGEHHAIVLDQPERFASQVRALRSAEAGTENPALRHILSVQSELTAAGGTLSQSLSKRTESPGGFSRTPFGRNLETAARVIASGTPVAAVKVTLDGFDTHAGQSVRHERLMSELGRGLAAFRRALQSSGDWDRVLVMTYSEFGRRAMQNASMGTDHGAAAPHFFLGGRVIGGLYGEQPSLTELSNGDLVHSTDFRRMYATAARRWWDLSIDEYRRIEPIECVRSV